jgi:hypothetical protein
MDALEAYVARTYEASKWMLGMETIADGRHRIVVRRRIPAPREVVYAAWIEPEGAGMDVPSGRSLG